MDAVPAAAKRDRFDAFEKLRDPSHASALTIEELIELGRTARFNAGQGAPPAIANRA